MFFNAIFLIVFLLVGGCEVFAQEWSESSDAIGTTDTIDMQVESANTQTNVVQGDNFFDVLPVDDSMTTNTTQRPAFLDDLQNSDSQTSITFVFIRAIVGFIFFFVLLYLAFTYIKKRSSTVLGSSDIIKVLATTHLSQNKSLSIVEIVDNIYFISTTDKTISMMSEITDKDTKDAIRLSYAKSAENVPDDTFASMFDKALYMLNIKKAKEDKEAIEVTKEMTERMRMMNTDVQSHLNNNSSESTNSQNTISFNKLNRYVENDAVGKNSSVTENSDDNDDTEAEITTTSKKRVSRKSTKK